MALINLFKDWSYQKEEFCSSREIIESCSPVSSLSLI
jgi:hypothetical protein